MSAWVRSDVQGGIGLYAGMGIVLYICLRRASACGSARGISFKGAEKPLR